MELGSRIEGWLKAKGRSRRELAEYCEVTTSAVCLWIGGGGVTQSNLAKIIDFLDIGWTDFYGKVPKPVKVAKSKRAAAGKQARA